MDIKITYTKIKLLLLIFLQTHCAISQYHNAISRLQKYQ